jgi:hypothetical protein
MKFEQIKKLSDEENVILLYKDGGRKYRVIVTIASMEVDPGEWEENILLNGCEDDDTSWCLSIDNDFDYPITAYKKM